MIEAQIRGDLPLISAKRFAAPALLACLTLASCSATASPQAAKPPSAKPTASVSTTIAGRASPAQPSAPPQTGPLEKGWKSYGGTAYVGCPERFKAGTSVLADIGPKVFDTKSGRYVAAAAPVAPPGENVTGAMCALSGTVDDMRVVYLLQTAKPAPGVTPEATHTTAFVFDLKSAQPLVSKELAPPTPDLKLSPPDQWRLAATATGVAWTEAFTDGHAPQSAPRTVLLSRTDLAVAWSDPQPARVWQDVLAFPRATTEKATGAELRLPTGEPIFRDKDIGDIWTVDAELADGPDKLVKITRSDSHSPPALSTEFYDLNSRSIVKIGDSESVSGGDLVAGLSDGKLFIDGHASSTSGFGFGVWNLRTHRWDLLRSRDEAAKMSISQLRFFGDRLYVTNTGGAFSVLALPGADPVASNWSVRPFERLSGWTLVCRGELATALNGDCQDIVMVQDQDGHYPGPWF